MFARYLWATFVIYNVFPAAMPNSADFRNDIELTAVVDPTISANEAFPAERYYDLTTNKYAWVCFQGVCDPHFNAEADDSLFDSELVLEQLDDLQEKKKIDNNGNWFAEAMLMIDYVTGPNAQQDNEKIAAFLADEDDEHKDNDNLPAK
jgi:hypothetical protein